MFQVDCLIGYNVLYRNAQTHNFFSWKGEAFALRFACPDISTVTLNIMLFFVWRCKCGDVYHRTVLLLLGFWSPGMFEILTIELLEGMQLTHLMFSIINTSISIFRLGCCPCPIQRGGHDSRIFNDGQFLISQNFILDVREVCWCHMWWTMNISHMVILHSFEQQF